jgi:hypothetical protein
MANCATTGDETTWSGAAGAHRLAAEDPLKRHTCLEERPELLEQHPGRERLTSSQGFVGEAAKFRDGSDDGDLPKWGSGCPPAKLAAGKHASEGAPQQRSTGVNQPTTTRSAGAPAHPAALLASTAG